MRVRRGGAGPAGVGPAVLGPRRRRRPARGRPRPAGRGDRGRLRGDGRRRRPGHTRLAGARCGARARPELHQGRAGPRAGGVRPHHPAQRGPGRRPAGPAHLAAVAGHRGRRHRPGRHRGVDRGHGPGPVPGRRRARRRAGAAGRPAPARRAGDAPRRPRRGARRAGAGRGPPQRPAVVRGRPGPVLHGAGAGLPPPARDAPGPVLAGAAAPGLRGRVRRPLPRLPHGRLRRRPRPRGRGRLRVDRRRGAQRHGPHGRDQGGRRPRRRHLVAEGPPRPGPGDHRPDQPRRRPASGSCRCSTVVPIATDPGDARNGAGRAGPAGHRRHASHRPSTCPSATSTTTSTTGAGFPQCSPTPSAVRWRPSSSEPGTGRSRSSVQASEFVPARSEPGRTARRRRSDGWRRMAEVSPLQEIEHRVQRRAGELSLDVSGDDGRAKLRALVDDEVAAWSHDFSRGLRSFDLADPDLVAERAFRNLGRLRPARAPPRRRRRLGDHDQRPRCRSS